MKISIPQPCQENWKEMLPEEKGRFCLSCQKCVLDFSKFSENEIITTLQNKPDICIKSTPLELQKVNQLLENKNKFRYLSFVRYSTIFFFLGIGTTTFSQDQKLANVISQKNNISDFEMISNDSIRIIKGRVIDSEGISMEGALVGILKHRDIRINTDKDGYFLLEIPKDIPSNNIFVDSDYGYFEYVLEDNSENQIVIPKAEIIREVMVVGQVFYKKSFLRRTLDIITWPFRQIGKIF